MFQAWPIILLGNPFQMNFLYDIYTIYYFKGIGAKSYPEHQPQFSCLYYFLLNSYLNIKLDEKDHERKK
jgi:hypothetical protein